MQTAPAEHPSARPGREGATADPVVAPAPAAGPHGEERTRAQDGVVVALARRGDRAAWAWLYRRYSGVVHGVLLTRVASQDAEDLVQDVFARAMKRIGTVRDGASIGAWLAAVARNHAVDHLRQQGRRRAGSLGSVGPASEEREPMGTIAAEAAEALAAIRRLPEAYSEALMLRLVEGLTGPEIAQRLGMTHGAVRVNLHRGMQMLRESMGKEVGR